MSKPICTKHVWKDPDTGRIMRFASKRAKRTWMKKRERAAQRAADGITIADTSIPLDAIHNGLARDAESKGRYEKRFQHRATSSVPRGNHYEGEKPIGVTTMLGEMRKREAKLSPRRKALLKKWEERYA